MMYFAISEEPRDFSAQLSFREFRKESAMTLMAEKMTPEEWLPFLFKKISMRSIMRQFGSEAVAETASLLNTDNPDVIANYLSQGGLCPEA